MKPSWLPWLTLAIIIGNLVLSCLLLARVVT
jgi:hypothetical protein